jgi:hypothetical protein
MWKKCVVLHEWPSPLALIPLTLTVSFDLSVVCLIVLQVACIGRRMLASRFTNPGKPKKQGQGEVVEK